MSARLNLYTSYRDAERTWLHSFTSAAAATEDPGDPSTIEECSLHYGELAFLLAGLKPCVLIQLPTLDLTLSLYRHVLQSQWTQLPAYKQQSLQQQHEDMQEEEHALGLHCKMITQNVRSPEMPLQGCVLVWADQTVRSHPQSDLIQRGINLLCPLSHYDREDTVPGVQSVISETDLAIMLDLPGRLPESETEMHQMIEVSYWHQEEVADIANDSPSEPQPTLLTAFAAQPDQIPNVQSHFKRYRDAVREKYGMRLKLHVQSMADML
ncbi:hypothetical protein BC939DRAFT_220710 [Gamsiella multidivaricata]|uniref:uncharacterized protein n=1 Tax=Gamsiella multidivaricata TaxID=101098 RepID=UPI00221EFD99|nr:uncharacterized protein BC939DRAFT_220710 [Gamsiella multidivaricata]KAI7831136.1 hypothetical protein BC939DRAFT_220710 [Gamsiella multidivaricata]